LVGFEGLFWVWGFICGCAWVLGCSGWMVWWVWAKMGQFWGSENGLKMGILVWG